MSEAQRLTPARQFYVDHLRHTPIGALLRACKRATLASRLAIQSAWSAASGPVYQRVGDAHDVWYRASYVRRYYWRRVKPAFSWLRHSREKENFTYDLTRQNKLHLAHVLAVATGAPLRELLGYIDELENDEPLRASIIALARTLPRRSNVDATAHFGRRAGWYALVRAMRPRVVVETGVDKGLGAAVLCAALRRNAAEDDVGRYFGTDINPAAGALLSEPYAAFGTILYGDSIRSLKKMSVTIDLFINDSDHTAGYEKEEYMTILPMLSADAVIVGDNAHVTDELMQFSQENGRAFLFWREDPRDHWYLGAGIGLSFRLRP